MGKKFNLEKSIGEMWDASPTRNISYTASAPPACFYAVILASATQPV